MKPHYVGTLLLILLPVSLLYAQTQTDWKAIKKQAEERFGRTDKRYVRVLHALFNKLYQGGNYTDAIGVEEEALQVEAKLFGSESYDYAMTVANLASVSLLINHKLEENERRLNSVLPILGRESPGSLPSYYSILASIYTQTERYTDAIATYETGIRYEKKHPNAQATALPSLLNGLGMLYSDMGNYSRAGIQFAQALQTMEKRGLNKQDLIMYLTIKQNLAASVVGIKQWQKGANLMEEVVKGLKDLIGEDHPRYFPALLNLAYFYVRLDRKEEALQLLKRCKSFMEKQATGDPFVYASLLNNIGSIELDFKNDEAAAAALGEALLALKKTNHANSPLELGTLENWCYSQWRLQKPAEVAKQMPKLTDGLLDRLFNLFTVSDERGRQRLIEDELESLDFHRSFLLANPTYKSLAELIYNEELALKGAVLGSNRQLASLLDSITDPTTKRDVETWLTLRKKLIEKQQAPFAQQDPNLDKLDIQVGEYEEKLIRTTKAFRQFKERQNINWQSIKAGLSANEAAVEFVTFHLRQPNRWADSIMYAALVLRPDFDQPVFVPLGEERQLKRFLNPKVVPPITQPKTSSPHPSSAHLASSSRGGELIGRQVWSDSLYRLVWQPIDSLLKNVRVIYYSPAGLLHNVSFYALSKKGTLLGNQYTLHQITSSRTLAAKRNTFRLPTNSPIQLYGGINYDKDLLRSSPESESAFMDMDSTFLKTVSSFKSLPGTRQEIDTIQRLIPWRIDKLMDDQATEESVKALIKSNPGIIHFATHGYFVPSMQDKESKKASVPIGVDYRPSQNAMLRSGLIMAGGNTTWKGGKKSKTGDDGILTAFEISQLDLSQTELVVLSACETGLGEIRNFEGVFGLQRAFKQAGVKRLLISLQKIPDKETVEFMTEFYKALLQKSEAGEAFVYAQRALQKRYPTRPSIWANFIFVE
ncbi:CHAT domain-containing protein [Spirosoma daeguense]